jgi:hypothetical protein
MLDIMPTVQQKKVKLDVRMKGQIWGDDFVIFLQQSYMQSLQWNIVS